MKKLVLCLVILVSLSGLGYGVYNTLYRVVDTYMTIDINPSIELEVSRMGNVIEATALNYDAEVLLSDLDLIGLSTEEATKLVVDNATEMGYIDEFDIDNEIVIVAYGDNDERAEAIETEIKEQLEKHLGEEKIPARVTTRNVTQEQKEEAEEKNISVGKLLYVEKISGNNSDLDKEELYNMSIDEINNEMKKGLDSGTVEEEETLSTKKQEYIENKDAELDEMGEALWEEKNSTSSGFSEQNKDEEIDELMNQEKNAVMNEFEEVHGNSSGTSNSDENDSSSSGNGNN